MNPIRSARLDLRLTQAELAHQLNVTPQSVLMLEQGLFSKLPDRIALELGVSQQDYQDWIKIQRYNNAGHFDQATTTKGWLEFRWSITGHSFRGFCRVLYFQPSILREHERYRQRNVQVLSEALIDAQLSDVALGDLNLFTREMLGLVHH
jgi:DNA-binding XRE family transcriptional regulator